VQSRERLISDPPSSVEWTSFYPEFTFSRLLFKPPCAFLTRRQVFTHPWDGPTSSAHLSRSAARDGEPHGPDGHHHRRDFELKFSPSSQADIAVQRGLGLEAAKHLSTMNPVRLIIAYRDVVGGEAVAQAIFYAPDCACRFVNYWELDLASFASVKARFTAEKYPCTSSV
jgi:hypothetical protein